ncbi:GNAT family acetyltransferase [Ceratobasidium theobromae]|uniref:GNAT family acetyltransferase n=1 Tax=Ceratobasidium theobromae TaxID=1582974 RepID=A0A5N5QNQ2_9AGAM|nr:GNAT family acetyltransferase [Ceratobasidium theobromae]
MPSLSSRPNISVTVHTTAGDFLSVALETLMQKEEQSNIVLALALKAQRKEQELSSGTGGQRNLWLCVWTTRASHRSPTIRSSLDFVFALNDNSFGGYPLFIWSNYPSGDLTPAFLEHRVQIAATRLHQLIPSERIFSVFGLVPAVWAFQAIWTHISGKIPEAVPFYAAKFSYCTKVSLQPATSRLPHGDSVRAAGMKDLDQVAMLCREFSQDSEFPLGGEESIMQALDLIREKRIWVYETLDVRNRPRIASMVASSRTSANVAAITKVYTTPAFRGRHYARYLVQWVTQHLLYNEGKDSVTLYVSHGNPAEKVYHQVGYVGLCGTPRSVMVEDWLEIGFQGTLRGHW